MKINDVSVIPLNFKLKSPFEFSGVKLEILEYALVRIRTEDGIFGYGECPAYWEPRNETQKSTIDAVNNLAKELIGVTCDDIDGRKKLFNQYIPSAYAAQCGIDVACYDIEGKVKDVPVAKLFGIPVKVPVEVAIPMTDEKTALGIVETALDNNIQTYKLKVGKDIKKELKVLRKIRNKIGSNKKIFIDANQAWKSADQAIEKINQFAQYDLCWVEQPLPAKATPEEYNELQQKISVPIMLDESVYTNKDVLVYNDSVKMFNIKLAKTGGISGAIDFYNEVKKFNKKCMLGSMIEGSLGTLAGLHFASVYSMQTTALNSYDLINDKLSFGPKIIDGYMNVSNLPGLGYQDESIFNKKFSR